MDDQIELCHEAPDAEEYTALRLAAGLSPKDIAGARIALKQSIYVVTLRGDDGQLVGMGRIIGDGGCFYHIVDIAVHPSQQGRGFGKLIMKALTDYLDANAHPGSYASLIADVPADQLYLKFGFEYTQPKSVGMYRRY
ncbi:acetyltransferase (GNAT) family protein [Paenibacillus cellulosilyticus]|uniref:Acetyltransferase (GNAT) family protein n=1 Tax=Paenibacillus cellulosilyticus TaxID=375489 RepID=A0A2V2YWL9_9BACL|nr:GNAT family N-acetyltransferase [Paenibacillus cellulosilyticus]PWW05156.1 acetyltransferase (GNAT) family protein [Paenibacillus cellulosilyticus]QKS48695.1 GNAT family N-acetyltransferase [Paenibacillus cellulosilyticus]